MNLIDALDLRGRSALITGGGSGIGKACAIALAQAGASICIVGRREEKLLAVQKEIATLGGTCIYYAADITQEENCKQMVDFCLSEFGRLDILINNAGSRGANGDLVEEFSTENYNEVIDIDLKSTFMAIKYAYPASELNGVGSIINIASLAALQARGPIVYSAAKGAVKSLSRTLAKRLGEKKIRVNTIYPGLIITEMTEGILQHPELESHFRNESPLGELGNVEDIAYCAVYLASDASKYITGQDFIIDGGVTC